MIYLMKSEARNGTYFKVGFTSNLRNRMIPYGTHNPNCQLLQTAQTYKKTKHQLEKAIHEEIKSLGFEFQTKTFLGLTTTTEWFFVPAYCEKEFEKRGLTQFKACKGRVIIDR